MEDNKMAAGAAAGSLVGLVVGGPVGAGVGAAAGTGAGWVATKLGDGHAAQPVADGDDE